jgi:DNA repair exonuclease SbcCD nuclease subunit
MVKILLTSDLHLGLRDESFPVPESVRINTFRKISAFAQEHDLLLIAGDLFDSSQVSDELFDIVSGEFNKIKKRNVEIIFTPGESEFGGRFSSSFYRLGATHVFMDAANPRPYSVNKGGQAIHVYGFPSNRDIDLAKIKRTDAEGFHIGLFHADFNIEGNQEESEVRIIQKDDIKSMDLDFYALGHRHNFRIYKYMNRMIGLYPGSPEASTFNEPDDRYVISITVGENHINQIKRIVINSAVAREINIDCDRISSSKTIIDSIEKNKKSNLILRVLLTGERNFGIDYSEINKFYKDFNRLIICDRSSPVIDILIEEHKNENTLRGEFFHMLKERLDSGKDKVVDVMTLSCILNQLTARSIYIPEEWLCK